MNNDYVVQGSSGYLFLCGFVLMAFCSLCLGRQKLITVFFPLKGVPGVNGVNGVNGALF